MNNREFCASRVLELTEELKGLHPGDLTGEELLAYAREAAANVERFLKRLDVAPRDKTFYGYIEALSALGLPDVDASTLHSLRKMANAGKHDPEAAAELESIQTLLERVLGAVSRVGIAGLAPGANAPAKESNVRTFVFVVSDYPTGGEVDYEICFLLDDGRAVLVDHYQLQFADEAGLVAELRQRGRLDQAPNDERILVLRNALAPSPEVSGVWMYQGTLHDVANAFGLRQHSEAIPSLQRKNNLVAVRVAAALAAVDQPIENLTFDNIRDVLQRHYALSGLLADQVASEVVELVAEADVEVLHGPRLVSKKRFRMIAPTSCSLNDKIGMAITPSGLLFVDIGDGIVPMP